MPLSSSLGGNLGASAKSLYINGMTHWCRGAIYKPVACHFDALLRPTQRACELRPYTMIRIIVFLVFYARIIAPVALSTRIDTGASGVGAGPCTTAAAFAGSKAAP